MSANKFLTGMSEMLLRVEHAFFSTPINDRLTVWLDRDPNSITWLVIVICVILTFLCWRPRCFASRIREIAPTLMVSAGIVGTFWGTFIALGHFETHGIGGGLDHKAMVESIPVVLEGMKTAFITTLVGLLFALVLRFLLKLMPETKPEPLPIENETIELLESIKKGLYDDDGQTLLPQLTNGFNTLNDNIQGLVQTIKDSLVQSMENLMEDLREVIINQLTEQLKKTNDLLREQLSEMLAGIEEALIKQFGETFVQFNEATQAIKRWQEDHRQQVEQLTEAFTLASEGVEQIRVNCDSIPETMKQLTALMGELDERLRAFADMKEQAEQSFPAIKKHLDVIGRDLKSSAAGFSNLDQTIQRIMEDSEGVARQYHEMVRGMLEEVRTTSQNMITEIQNVSNQSQEEMQAVVASVKEAVDSCVADTANAVIQISEENTQRVNNAMADIVQAWGENMVGIAKTIQESTNNQQQQ